MKSIEELVTEHDRLKTKYFAYAAEMRKDLQVFSNDLYEYLSGEKGADERFNIKVLWTKAKSTCAKKENIILCGSNNTKMHEAYIILLMSVAYKTGNANSMIYPLQILAKLPNLPEPEFLFKKVLTLQEGELAAYTKSIGDDAALEFMLDSMQMVGETGSGSKEILTYIAYLGTLLSIGDRQMQDVFDFVRKLRGHIQEILNNDDNSIPESFFLNYIKRYEGCRLFRRKDYYELRNYAHEMKRISDDIPSCKNYRNVSLSNLQFNIAMKETFSEEGIVYFRNCRFNWPVEISNVERVTFENCYFHDIIKIKGVRNEISFNKCEFHKPISLEEVEDVIVKYSTFRNIENKQGFVIGMKKTKKIILECDGFDKCEARNCPSSDRLVGGCRNITVKNCTKTGETPIR